VKLASSVSLADVSVAFTLPEVHVTPIVTLAALFLLRLGAGDISRVPSALIGKPAPQTELAPLPGLERDGTPVPGLIRPSSSAR
jgi:hypothetical protein